MWTHQHLKLSLKFSVFSLKPLTNPSSSWVYCSLFWSTWSLERKFSFVHLMAWTIPSQLRCWCTPVHSNKGRENKTQQQLSISLMTPRFRPQRSPPLEEHNISEMPQGNTSSALCRIQTMYLTNNIPTNHSSGSSLSALSGLHKSTFYGKYPCPVPSTDRITI